VVSILAFVPSGRVWSDTVSMWGALRCDPRALRKLLPDTCGACGQRHTRHAARRFRQPSERLSFV